MDLKCNRYVWIEDQYIDGIKRLTAISKSHPGAIQGDKRDPNGSDIGARHVCLVCGYMWNANPKKREGPKKCPACVSIHWNNVDLKRHVCKQCSHRWMSSVGEPIMCPHCRSKLWNKDTEKFFCKDCRNVWVHKLEKGAPGKCARCQSENISCRVIEYKCGRCGCSGKVGPAGITSCPVCKASALVFTGSSQRTRERDAVSTGCRKSSIDLDTDPVITEILRSKTDDTKKIIELTSKHNMEFLKAEVLVRYHSGENVVSIARNTDESLDAVVMMTLPFSKRTAEGRVQ